MARHIKKSLGDMLPPETGSETSNQPFHQSEGLMLPPLPSPAQPTMAEIHADLTRTDTAVPALCYTQEIVGLKGEISEVKRLIALLAERPQNPQPMLIPESVIEDLSTRVCESLDIKLARLETALERLEARFERIVDRLGQLAQQGRQVIQTTAVETHQALVAQTREAVYAIRGVRNVAHNEIAALAFKVEKWTKDLSAFIQRYMAKASRDAIDSMDKSTSALTQLASVVGGTAGMIERFFSELDYLNPAVTQNGENRLRRVAIQTGLISSAVTTVGIAIVFLMMRALGVAA